MVGKLICLYYFTFWIEICLLEYLLQWQMFWSGELSMKVFPVLSTLYVDDFLIMASAGIYKCKQDLDSLLALFRRSEVPVAAKMVENP